MAQNLSPETRKITYEDIERFMNGKDPMERIVNLSYNYSDKYITVQYRNENDEKKSDMEPFYPFAWATLHACLKLCDGNRAMVTHKLNEYGIGIKKLRDTNSEGRRIEAASEGYLFMFFAKYPMSYSTFLKFFRDCGNPVYPKKDKDGNDIYDCPEDKNQYLVVNPQEQYLIYTGKRFFKGYNDYDDLLRMTFDLETTGLNFDRDIIKQLGVSFNRPMGNLSESFRKIYNKGDNGLTEIQLVDLFFKIIAIAEPDVVCGHNIENFDVPMLMGACKRASTTIEDVSRKYFRDKPAKKEDKETVLKLGGEVESFRQTQIPGTIVTDSLHAVRRAQALDSNMLKADLKYSAKYAGLIKNNRVYTPGDKIDEILTDTENKYAFNDSDGDWYIYDESSERSIEPRSSYDSDEEYDAYLKTVKGKQGDAAFRIRRFNNLADGYVITTGKYIVERYLYDDLWEGDRVEWKYNSTNFLISKMIPVPYKKCTTMGTAGQWKSIMLAWSYENELAIPLTKPKRKFTGGLSRLLRTGYVKNVIKLDYNSLYPSICLTWGISDEKDLDGVMLMMLEYILTGREKYKGLKKLADNIIASLEEVIKNKTYTNEQLDEYNKAYADFSLSDGKQAQFKCFGNSFFGSYGATDVFNHGSLKCAEQITCIGRQCLRLMISYFSRLGYVPIVGDTDGFNFQLPDNGKFRYTPENPYIGKGMNREVKLGKEYIYYDADVAEFNDLYMNKVYNEKGVQKMGLSIDEQTASTINFSRKNYADYFPEKPYPKDVKMVGNTIKSKKMPDYIAKFLSKGVRLLLQGQGYKFIEEYYTYLDNIYSYRIPIRDIATKGKIKKSVKQYKKDVGEITKAGRPKSRQAWYELAIKDNLKVDNGDTLYYVNTGTSKSHADVKKTKVYRNENGDDITKDVNRAYRAYEKSVKENGGKKLNKDTFVTTTMPEVIVEDKIELNCVLIPRDVIDSERDMFCSEVNIEYNSAKYVSMFNSRIKPLLVCFSKDIRDEILVNNPSDRKVFTEEQCELVSGEPNKVEDQDTYEKLMTMEDKELKFWTTYGLIPPFLDECGMGKWEDIVDDYNKRMEIERENGIENERNLFSAVIDEMTDDELTEMIETLSVPKELSGIIQFNESLGCYTSILYENIVIGQLSDLIETMNDRKNYLDETISE